MAGGGGTTQSVTRQEIDPDLKQRNLALFSDASRFLNETPFQAFPGQLVAGQQPLQGAAQSFLTNRLLGQPIGFQAPEQFGPFQPSDPFTFSSNNTFSPIGSPRNPIVGPDGQFLPPEDEQRNLFGPRGDDLTKNNSPLDDPFAIDPGTVGQAPPPSLAGLPDVTPQPDPFVGTLPIEGGPRQGTGTGTVDAIGTNQANVAPEFGPFADPTGFSETNQAASVAQQLTGFNPLSVNAQQAGTATAAPVADIGDPRFSAQRLGELQNPFTDQVIDQSLNDLNRARQVALNDGARSTSAGVFGGDRQAIRESETNRAFADAAARQSAQLRSAGFDRAAGLAGSELGLGLQAALANQRSGLGLNQFNADAINRQGQFNSGLGLQAQLANQQADLAGAGTRLGAAGALSGFGGDLFGRTLQTGDVLNRLGAQNQQQAQSMINAEFDQFQRARNDPMRGFGLLQGILGGIPVGFNTTQMTPNNTGAGIAGGALTGAGIGSAFGPIGGGLGALGGGLLGLF